MKSYGEIETICKQIRRNIVTMSCEKRTSHVGSAFSMVEILSPCPTNWKMSPAEAWKWIDEVMAKEFPLGVILDRKGEEDAG